MPLTKRFTRIGNSFAVIFDQPILKQVDMNPETSEVDISVEDHAIVLRLHRYATDEQARAASKAVIAKHQKLLTRLAK